MGNSLACFSPAKLARSSSDHEIVPSSASNSFKKPEAFDDSYIKQQAQIASKLYLQHLQKNSGDLLLHFDRSVSTKNPPTSSLIQQKLSKRSRSVSCSAPLSLHLPDQAAVTSDGGAESKHFVLVHGGGFGAWCWYKIIALLREAKCEVDAINLTGSGPNFCDINSITTLAQYAKPLTNFLAKLSDDKQVVLVGHDLGGVCISHAMELHPEKVSKAIFVAATMLSNGQSALDVFSQKPCSSGLNQQAQKFQYANGKDQPPTAIDYDESLLEDFLFNRTSSKVHIREVDDTADLYPFYNFKICPHNFHELIQDIALASVSMRSIPFAPVSEKISLSAGNYGSVPRFYIKTDQDFIIPKPLQEAMIQANPPEKAFELKASDHSPFFSRPQALHRLLMEISDLPQN